MTADNWDICPWCKKLVEKRKEEKIRLAKESYGNVRIEDFERLRLEATKQTKLDETLREDYSIGITVDEDFYVEYSARCLVCGFSFKFKHEQKVGEKISDDSNKENKE